MPIVFLLGIFRLCPGWGIHRTISTCIPCLYSLNVLLTHFIPHSFHMHLLSVFSQRFIDTFHTPFFQQLCPGWGIHRTISTCIPCLYSLRVFTANTLRRTSRFSRITTASGLLRHFAVKLFLLCLQPVQPWFAGASSCRFLKLQLHILPLDGGSGTVACPYLHIIMRSSHVIDYQHMYFSTQSCTFANMQWFSPPLCNENQTPCMLWCYFIQRMHALQWPRSDIGLRSIMTLTSLSRRNVIMTLCVDKRQSASVGVSHENDEYETYC
jgi:hypothetical protein